MSNATRYSPRALAKARLINLLREDLKKQMVTLTHTTIERLVDAYDRRRARAGAHRNDADPVGSAEGNEPA